MRTRGCFAFALGRNERGKLRRFARQLGHFKAGTGHNVYLNNNVVSMILKYYN